MTSSTTDTNYDAQVSSDGMPFYFVIRAANSNGEGPASEEVCVVMPISSNYSYDYGSAIEIVGEFIFFIIIFACFFACLVKFGSKKNPGNQKKTLEGGASYRFCHACGTAYPRDDKFCKYCGAKRKDLGGEIFTSRKDPPQLPLYDVDQEPAYCSNCGAHLSTVDANCKLCGAKRVLPNKKPPPPANDEVETQQDVVEKTAFFCPDCGTLHA
jgi:hypothetical protein